MVGKDPSVVAHHVQITEGERGVGGEHGVVSTDAHVDQTHPDHEEPAVHLRRQRQRTDENGCDYTQQRHRTTVRQLVHEGSPHGAEETVAHRTHRSGNDQETIIGNERLTERLPVARHEGGRQTHQARTCTRSPRTWQSSSIPRACKGDPRWLVSVAVL